jgi:hypothetical protein
MQVAGDGEEIERIKGEKTPELGWRSGDKEQSVADRQRHQVQIGGRDLKHVEQGI